MRLKALLNNLEPDVPEWNLFPSMENLTWTLTLSISCAASTDSECWRILITITVMSWFLRQCNNPQFYSLVITDVAKFESDSKRNTLTEYRWIDSSPYAMIEFGHLTWFLVEEGIFSDHQLRPTFSLDILPTFVRKIFGSNWLTWTTFWKCERNVENLRKVN